MVDTSRFERGPGGGPLTGGETGTRTVTPEVTEFFEGLPERFDRGKITGGVADGSGAAKSRAAKEQAARDRAEAERKADIQRQVRANQERARQEAIQRQIEGERIRQQTIQAGTIAGQVSAPATGTGTFTRAVDIGGGRMQDALFGFSEGRITESELLGVSFPQTERFRESRMTDQLGLGDIGISPLSFDPEEIARRRAGLTGQQLKASKEAEKRLREQIGGGGVLGEVSRRFDIGQQRVRGSVVEPITGIVSTGVERLGQVTGVDFPTTIEEAKVSARRTTDILEERAFPKFITQTGEFIAGTGLGVTERFIERPLEQAAIFGVGVGLGAGLGFIGAGAGAVGGATGAGVFTAAEVGVGAALLGMEFKKTEERLKISTDALSSGEIIGDVATDIGLIGGGIALGQRGATKGIGFVRTFGRQELPASDIIAPEFFEGQRFPGIRKGQTAVELRGEFFETVLPGETLGQPRGFTARSQDLGSIIPPSRGKRGELVGLFQAPRVSPSFLRIGGEDVSFFGLSTRPAGRPSIIRLATETIELAPGVLPGARTPSPLKFDPKLFSESIEGSGRSIIPFIKTEKEAVVPVGTQVIKTGEEFFTRFEGVRVPIKEFKTDVSDIGKIGIPETSPVFQLEQPTTSSSIGRIKQPSVITPVSVGFPVGVLGLERFGTDRDILGSERFERTGRDISKDIGITDSSDFLPPSEPLPPPSRGPGGGGSGGVPSSFVLPPSEPGRVAPIISDPSGFISEPSRPSRPSRITPSISGSDFFDPSSFADITQPPTFGERVRRPRKKPKGRKKKAKGIRRRAEPLAPSLTGISLFQLGDITGELVPTGLLKTRFVPKKRGDKKKIIIKKTVKKKVSKKKK